MIYLFNMRANGFLKDVLWSLPCQQEAVFMGNGEQYIWKPPEDDDIITLHAPPHLPETRKGQPPAPTAKEVSSQYI